MQRTRSSVFGASALALCTLAGSVGSASAQAFTCSKCADRSYEASLGVVPAEPCWITFGSGLPEMTGSAVRLASTGTVFGYQAYYRPTFLWSEGQTMEARLRVPAGGAVAPAGFRAATYVGAIDSMRQGCFVLVWRDGFALATDNNWNPGPGLAQVSFDAASEFHTYTMITNSEGASLSVDGVERLRLPYTTTHASISDTAEWGTDSRYTGPTDSEWQYVRFPVGAGHACAADCSCDGRLSIADFTCFQNAFALGDLKMADTGGLSGCTPDGQLTVTDFTCFQNRFALGCP